MPGAAKPAAPATFMVAVATETVEDADVVLWLVDITTPPTEEDRAIGDLLLQMARKRKLPRLVLGLNHVDHWNAPEGNTGERVDEYARLVEPLIGKTSADGAPLLSTAVLSAATGVGVDALLALLRSLLPLGPRYYPEDQVTDLQMRFIAGELIREKALLLLQDEVPHSLAVEVDEFVERRKASMPDQWY